MEREERMEKLAARLTGLDLSSEELDCSNRIIDKCIETYVYDCMIYLSLEEVTRKEMEL